ncbi:MAG: Gfo/Idh/MocA family oxidoreductase [Candidatus Nanopelagicaceae bacterium]|nr:Gfo/Idh/MocA family oxidoreductase [Candidatus Nanopelagicaceae bacterium]
MTDFRWGVIGTGSIAKAFAKDLSFVDGHLIAGVGSRSLESAQAFSDQFGGNAFGSYEELVQADIDGVYVATPHPFHSPNTLLALQNGKPVLCEKPFAVNAKESAAMIAKAQEKNLLLVEAMWSRFLPHYRLIKQLLQQEALGEIKFLYADHGQNLPAERHPRLHIPELAGGALLDLGIYPISLSYLIFGKPQRITSRASFTSTGVDESTSIIFEYEANRQANLHTTLAIKTPCTATIIGTKATLEIQGSFYTPTSMTLKSISGEVINYPKEYLGHGLREQAIEFANLIKSGKKESDLMTLQDTQSIMETMDEIRAQIGLSYPFEN